jgi:hypothetical protein
VTLDAQAVADAFGLGRASSLSEPVARGEIGEVRRLETDRGVYAVKQAFEPLSDQEVADLDVCGSFHRSCWQAGVATPEPIPAVTGGFVARHGVEHVLAYSWVDLVDPDTSLDPAAVGRLVASLHAVRHPTDAAVHEWFEAPIGRREWEAVLEASLAAGAPYAGRLAELVPALVEVETVLTPMSPVQTCHLDLWSDNLRRTPDEGLCVIDFENAGPGDPARELAMVLVEFGRRDAGRLRLLYDAYRDAGGPGRITGRDSFAMTVAQLHHIGRRHLRIWIAARDPEARARSRAGVEEFLGQPFLLPDVDGTLEVLL